jgi:hypothetical protein
MALSPHRRLFFQRIKNILMLAQQHFRGRYMVEAHIAHAIHGRFEVFNRIPGQLTIGNLRELLVKFIIQLEEIIQLLALDGGALLIKILLQLITLAIVDHPGGAASHRALNGLADEAAIAHLRQGNFIHIAAALGRI